jgi:hypothetical protein
VWFTEAGGNWGQEPVKNYFCVRRSHGDLWLFAGYTQFPVVVQFDSNCTTTQFPNGVFARDGIDRLLFIVRRTSLDLLLDESWFA